MNIVSCDLPSTSKRIKSRAAAAADLQHPPKDPPPPPRTPQASLAAVPLETPAPRPPRTEGPRHQGTLRAEGPQPYRPPGLWWTCPSGCELQAPDWSRNEACPHSSPCSPPLRSHSRIPATGDLPGGSNYTLQEVAITRGQRCNYTRQEVRLTASGPLGRTSLGAEKPGT